jgi:hypothetical protein
VTQNFRRGTHNGPGLCIHGRTMKQDNCADCWDARGWKDLDPVTRKPIPYSKPPKKVKRGV